MGFGRDLDLFRYAPGLVEDAEKIEGSLFIYIHFTQFFVRDYVVKYVSFTCITCMKRVFQRR